ncbi:hypothetical protein NQ317_018928 [Molorchus minor]|uniref:Transmembrane protein 231 n=1 Tax=Molorchus minor TaxID=1323400 RepID=A0ABQ9JC00_9CUCU|nr:hypothetical protein NQ317_018928 [Molorchus minor]
MVILEVHARFIKVKYKSTLLSQASFLYLREIDNNLDGKNDKLSLSIEINTLDNKITELHLVLPLNYQLTTTCPLKMQSAIIYQHYFPHKRAIDLRIVGNLNIFQSSAIRCDGKGYNFYDHSVIDNEKNEYELEDIIKRYSDRNVSTHLTNVYTNIKTGNENKFNLKLMIRYPEHKIHYKPRFWQIIKWAWMQYFAVFIIISWLITRVKELYLQT